LDDDNVVKAIAMRSIIVEIIERCKITEFVLKNQRIREFVSKKGKINRICITWALAQRGGKIAKYVLGYFNVVPATR
jgi:hypothetical protein